MSKIAAVIVSSALLAVSGAAVAHNCPNEMKAIDAKLATKPKLSDADAKKVADLRKKGEDEHKAGKHTESMKSLGDAKKTLGI